MPPSTGNLASTLGFALTRIVVPLWVLSGAIFKLIEQTPGNLPSQILANAKALGCTTGACMDWLLVSLISIEFLLVAVMFFLARLARPAAIFILSVFCLVLLNEMRAGNFQSCGCLGNIPVKPWQMLAIDGGLLLGVIVTGLLATSKPMTPWRYGAAAAAVFTLAGVIASVAQIIPDRRPEVIAEPAPEPIPTPPEDEPGKEPGIAPPLATGFTPARPPKTYVTPDDKNIWVGKPWREVELLQFLPRPPKDIDQGTRYVVFYSRSCEHCEQMFWNDLIMPIGEMVTAVEIPGPQSWEMPATKCEMMSLPEGTNWIITPPLAFKVVDGIVQCASEADHTKCIEVQ